MIGSSSIIIPGFTGNDGPLGPTGAIGPTGATAINCTTLAIGNTASYIKNIIQLTSPIENYGNFQITYSDDSSITFAASPFMGNTLFDASGVTVINTAISLVSGISFGGTIGSGSTANIIFKRLSSNTSGITLSSGITFIVIDGAINLYSSTGFTQDKIVYFKTPSSLAGITTSMSFTGGVLHFNEPNGVNELVTRLISNTVIKNIESTVRGSSGSYLNVSEAGLFYINTPNGIMGFTGFSGASGSTGEIRSLTMIIQNDSVWNFPDNVWFRPNEANLSCGENILNLTTQDNGKIWKANFFGKGYGVFPGNCTPSQLLGACYSSNDCKSYVTKESCDGIFCPHKICQPEVEVDGTGSCCINGICRDNVSKFLCEKYGGRHWTALQTQGQGCAVIECWDPCYPEISSCCVGLSCYDRYTEVECSLAEGVFSKVSCKENTCNIIANTPGACCYGYECIPNKTYNECTSMGGAFMGTDEVCSEIECDCIENNSICSTVISDNSELCLGEYDLHLHGLPILTDNATNKKYIKINVTTQSYTIADKIIFVASNHPTDAPKKTLYRSSPSTVYGSCTTPSIFDAWKVIVALPNHPYLGGSADIEAPESIIHSTACLNGENTFTVTVTQDQVEMVDSNDPWYKKIRMFVIGACSADNTSISTKFDISFDCSATPSPAAMASVQKSVKIFGSSLNEYVSMNIIDLQSNFNKIGIL